MKLADIKPESIIYEDNLAIAFLVEKPAAKGHVAILPKKPAKFVEDISIEDLQHLFYLSSFTATTLFESLGAQGTNILASEDDGFRIDVIARMQEDGLNFQWQPKQMSSGDLDAMTSGISSNIIFKDEEAEGPAKHPPAQADQVDDISAGSEEENMMIKHLERIP